MSNKLALAMIVKGSDDEADALTDCLNSIRPYVDGAFITLTQENQKVRDVCEYFDCEVSFFEWEDDFAKARNHSFEQVPDEYDYILWLDADDILENAKELKRIIKENPADAYSMWYLYALDENDDPVVVHRKTQVVKNDGSFRWQGRIHEDIVTDRQVDLKHIDDIRRIHLSYDERFHQAKERNLRIAEKQVEDNPGDPRSYWNLGNAQKALGMWQESIDTFDTFIRDSESDQEKYMAFTRQAESYSQLGKEQDAIEKYRRAIGLYPDFPDAYIGLGKLFYKNGQYPQARKFLMSGLQKDPPYLDLIVYNPREYDYEPLKYLALSYVELGQAQLAYEAFKACAEIKPNDESLQQLVKDFKEKAEAEEGIHEKVEELQEIEDKDKLKEELDNIPEDFKSHPLICRIRNKNFIKEDSSGKDIIYFCGESAENWTPKTAEEEGIGGSEEAVINLTKRWAEAGYNVTVYNSCGHKVQEFDGVTYKPHWMFNPRDKQDVAILWRMPAYCEADLNADKTILDMHDAFPDAEFTEERIENIDQIFVKSEFHRSLYPSVPDEKITVIPNGINPDDFDPDTEKDDKLLINTSSPDRSISALIEGFKKVKEEVPDAKCKWAYGWNVFDASAPSEKKLRWKEEMQEKAEETEGFEVLGRISHGEVAELYNEATIFAYPTEFAEICCISLTKSLAAGCVPVTSDFSALGEKTEYGGVFLESDKTKDTWMEPHQFDFALDEDRIDEWAEAVIEQLKNPDEIDTEQVKDDYSWDTIAKCWEKEF